MIGMRPCRMLRLNAHPTDGVCRYVSHALPFPSEAHALVTGRHHPFLSYGSTWKCRSLTRMFIDELQELVIHRPGLFRGAVPHRLCRAVFEVIAHQGTSDASERLLHRRDLDHDVCAVAVRFHHLLEPPNLAFNPAQPLQVRRLQSRVHAHGLSPLRLGPTAAHRVTGLRVPCHGLSSFILRWGIYNTPLGYMQEVENIFRKERPRPEWARPRTDTSGFIASRKNRERPCCERAVSQEQAVSGHASEPCLRPYRASQGLCPLPWLTDGTASRSALRCALARVTLGVLVELLLAAWRAEVIGLSPILTPSGCLLFVHLHPTHGISCHHGSPPFSSPREPPLVRTRVPWRPSPGRTRHSPGRTRRTACRCAHP